MVISVVFLRDFDVFCVSFIVVIYVVFWFFFFKQKTAYEMRISDWSSDVCSSDLSKKSRAALRDFFEVDAKHIALAALAALDADLAARAAGRYEIGRASCRASVCQYV